MKVDYQDINTFVKLIIKDAKNEGASLSSIDELCIYLTDNYSNNIEITVDN